MLYFITMTNNLLLLQNVVFRTKNLFNPMLESLITKFNEKFPNSYVSGMGVQKLKLRYRVE
jgi:hypothetical protein